VIAWLKGVLTEKHPPRLVVDVHGVGYELEAPMTTFSVLPETGAEVSLFTHLVVREDAHQLYGFHGRNDRDVFRMLIKVNGVGAKLALTILSGMDVTTFGHCVFEGDTARLSRLPGIGKKTAERLVIEMRDRLHHGAKIGTIARSSQYAAEEMAADPRAEAIEALIALGLKPQEAGRRVQGIDADGLACEEIVRLALKAMVR